MFCPSCGAKNPTGARSCSDCKRPLPQAPGARASLSDVAATVADMPDDRHPPIAPSSTSGPNSAPTVVPGVVPGGPTPAPAQPPRILKKPQPLAPAPAPVDAVPRRGSAVGPDDPTLVRPRVVSPPPVTMPRGDPFGSEPSTTRPLADLPPTSVGGETEELPPAPAPPPPAPRPVTIAKPPPTLASPPPTYALPPEELPRRPTPRASTVSSVLPSVPTSAPIAPPTSPRPVTAASSARPATQSRAPAPSVSPSVAPSVAPSAAMSASSSPSAVAPPSPSSGASSSAAAEAMVGASAAAIADPVAQERVRLELAGSGRLLFAALIDTVLAGALASAALVAFLGARGVRVGWQPVVDMLHADPVMGALSLLGAPTLVVAGYHFACVLVLSGTLGHLALGLRVRARASGERPGVVRALVRALGTALGVLLFGIGPAWALFLDGERRGLGDLVARTAVVRARASAQPAAKGRA